MNNETKEILARLKNNDFERDCNDGSCYKELYLSEIEQLLDYITNLQEENKSLKEQLNCKEYFSSTMPEGTEFVILTKANYDRQQKDIELELIDYKSRCEKAIEYVDMIRRSCMANTLNEGVMNMDILLNILEGDNNNERDV